MLRPVGFLGELSRAVISYLDSFPFAKKSLRPASGHALACSPLEAGCSASKLRWRGLRRTGPVLQEVPCYSKYGTRKLGLPEALVDSCRHSPASQRLVGLDGGRQLLLLGFD
ncbi:hypothetical protein Q31a_01060 [Aureliella helgolandensis]|uniref:Uncharacterized protein n=1 Tax=Aureliella helgolandensis TaxID=2527968 RepID=A0A518FZP2_9BACT|nr:hypothetical protein Q31a_01060 [Aureliella helgolandensis]